jgi:5'-AMP-activated protein kinase regulatory gamma subunit
MRSPPGWSVITNTSQDFPGIFTCSLSDSMGTIYDTIRKSRVHRFIVVDSESRLKGILTLSDVLDFTLLEGLEDDE